MKKQNLPMDAALEFLRHSLLGDARLVQKNYSNISNRVLENELRKYCELAMQRRSPAKHVELGVYTPGRSFTDAIRTYALYSDAVYLDDPIAGIANSRWRNVGSPTHGPGSRRLPKDVLASTVAAIQRLPEAFESGFVVFLPEKEQQTHLLPWLFSNANYADLLPQSIMEVYRERATARTVVNTPDGRSLVLTILRKCQAGEDVHVRFEGCENEATGFTVPSSIVNGLEEDFLRFVDGCINRGSWMMYGSLMRDADVAAEYGLRLSSRNQLDADIMMHIGRFRSDDFVCSALPELRVPTLESVPIRSLLRIRNDYRSFVELRSKLREGLSRARLAAERNDAIDAVSELIEEDLVRAEDELRSFRLKAGLSGATIFAGLCLTAAWSPLALLVAGVAAAPQLKALLDDETLLRRSPGYCILRAVRGS